jgi:hypothetical protein
MGYTQENKKRVGGDCRLTHAYINIKKNFKKNPKKFFYLKNYS